MAVIVVTYQSEDVISACLHSLLGQTVPAQRIIIVDNDSTDATIDEVCKVVEPSDLSVRAPGASLDSLVTLIRAGHNSGFAAGVNIGLRAALGDSKLDHFWILNPDCVAERTAIRGYCEKINRTGAFALMGGRTLYMAAGDPVQSDGGCLSRWTAVCRNINQGRPARLAAGPARERLDYLSGANVVASRQFVERAGLMREDFFLYYEEVEWAMRRGALPLAACRNAIVRHHGGTAAGSGTFGRSPDAFANYYNYRNRLRFAWRHMPLAVPGAYAYSLAKIAQLALTGARAEAVGAFLGLHQLKPPASVRQRLLGDGSEARPASMAVNARRAELTDS